MEEYTLETQLGSLWTSSNHVKPLNEKSPSILYLHGNSIGSKIFEPLLEHSLELQKEHQVILWDFPGHGRSSNAPNPDRSYYQYAYAEAALEVLRHYQVKKAILLGWSMGGHAALELVSALAAANNPSDPQILGIWLTGTPPVPKQQITEFKKDGADVSALFKPEATKEDMEKVAEILIQTRPVPQWIVDDLMRTDQAGCKMMVIKFFEGLCSDQIKIAHDFTGRWVADVNGGDDPMLDLDYCDKVLGGAPRLWRGKCIRMEGQGHTPFFDEPVVFAKLFAEFVADCEA